MAQLRESGSVETRPLGGKRHGKLGPAEAFLLEFAGRASDPTMPELATALLAEKGIKAVIVALADQERLELQKTAPGIRTKPA